jgi:DNA primase
LPHQEVFFVEGYTDVIALADKGFLAVASMGTSVTEGHLKQLWSMSSRPYVAFDGDLAGRRAAERFVDIALPHLSHNRSIKVISLPPGVDPAEIVQNSGADGWAKCRDGAADLIDIFQSKISGTPEDQQAALASLKKQIQRIQDKELRERYYSTLLSSKPQRWVPRLRIAPVPHKLHLIFGMLHKYPELCMRFQEQISLLEVEPHYKTLKQDALSIADGQEPEKSWQLAERWERLLLDTEDIELAAEVWLELFASYRDNLTSTRDAVQQYLRNPTHEHWEMLVKK